MLREIGTDELFRRFGRAYRWLVTISGMICAMSMVLSATMVNVAVPSIMAAFGVGQDLAQWAATAFLATMVASQLLSSWATRAFGPRNAFTFALVVFVLGSITAASASSIDLLVLGRVLQGFSAGIVQPLVMAAIMQVFPESRRGFAAGLYGIGVMLAPSFGPLLGGVVIDYLGWRHVFVAPIPLVAITLATGLVLMPTKKFEPALLRFDWLGYGLLVVALICIVGGIGNGQRWGWRSAGIISLFAFGLMLMILFVISQLRSHDPLLDLALFLDARFASVMAIAFAIGFGSYASNYLIPVFAQTVQGYTATKAGMVLVPAGLFLASITPISARLGDSTSPHLPLIGGCVLFAVSAWLMSLSEADTAFWAMAGYAVLSRVAIGLVMPSMGKFAMQHVDAERLNASAGTYNFVRQMGGAFGVNATVVVVETRSSFYAEVAAGAQSSASPAKQAPLPEIGQKLQDGTLPDHLLNPQALDFLDSTGRAEAQMLGSQDGFVFLTTVFVLTLLPAFVLGWTSRPLNKSASDRR